MNGRQVLILSLLAVASATAAFFGSRMLERCGYKVDSSCWIDSRDADVEQMQTQLESQTQDIMGELAVLRQDLFNVVADPCEPDSVVIDKLNAMTAVHHKLVRTIFEHIVTLRDVLPREQKDRLTNVCSQLLAKPKAELARRNGWGRGGANSKGHQRRNRNGCFGVGRRLQLTDAQKQILCPLDPVFADHSARLTGDLLAGMDKLKVLVADETATKDEILQSLEQVLKIHGELELCTLEYLLKIKPHLSNDQRDMLKGMCRQCACAGQGSPL